MRLITPETLIGSAATFSAFVELRPHAASGGATDLASGVFGLAVGVGFAVRLRRSWTRDAPGR